MLTTERLCLRLPRIEDAAALEELNRLNWPRVGNRLRTLEETQDLIRDTTSRIFASPGWHEFVAERRDDGRIVGRVAVNFDGPGERQAEIGYGVHPDSRGQGYGPEAVGRTLTHLFGDCGLHRVVAITGVDNHPSRRLLEKLGFRLEGQTIESFLHQAQGRFVDELIYAVLAREWPRR